MTSVKDLDEAQLLMLSTIAYLEGVAVEKDATVGEVVKYLLHKGGLADSQIPEKKSKSSEYSCNMTKRLTLGKILGQRSQGEYPCNMTKKEWVNLLKLIEKDKTLTNLKIKHGITEATGFRAFWCVDENNNAVLVYRGTASDFQWHDNGQGGYLPDTEQQNRALEYFEEHAGEYNYVIPTGHSKGGNLAMYTTIVSDSEKIGRCVSFDGQGFSLEFKKEYEDNIEKSQGKILSVCAKNDFVNCLLSPVGKKIYIETEKQEQYINNHCPHIMLDKRGHLREITEQDELTERLGAYSVSLLSAMSAENKVFAMDGIMAFFEENPEESKLQQLLATKMIINKFAEIAFANAVKERWDNFSPKTPSPEKTENETKQEPGSR